MIMNAGLPEEVIQEIEAAYADMCLCNLHSCGKDCAVAVRSSATAEDLPTASFAGQQASFLNVVGKNSVANTVLECLASVFTDRAIAYRVHNGFDHMAVKGAVSVQLMVRSDLASSGVAFTLDPDTGFRDAIVITGSYGLGELKCICFLVNILKLLFTLHVVCVFLVYIKQVNLLLAEK